MARGDSGRIVLEIDPGQKGDLYRAIERDGLTLKDWFLQRAAEYIRNQDQLSLFSAPAISETTPRYAAPLGRGRKAQKTSEKGQG